MRSHGSHGCDRCHRKHCSCAGATGATGGTGGTGATGATGEAGAGTTSFQWSGASAVASDTPLFHGDPGFITGNDESQVEYPIVGAQSFTTFRTNVIGLVGGEGNSLVFTVSRRAGGVGPFVLVATTVYVSGAGGQLTALQPGPYVFSDGDTVALQTTVVGAGSITPASFTGVLV